jgi:hypothetical protein
MGQPNFLELNEIDELLNIFQFIYGHEESKFGSNGKHESRQHADTRIMLAVVIDARNSVQGTATDYPRGLH